MSQTSHAHGSHGNISGKGGRARDDPIGTGGSTADGQLTHQDPLQGLANAQTGVTTKSTVGYSTNQTPGAVTNRGQIAPDNQADSDSNGNSKQ
ncbi:unnamed protein product [Adineta ricciae]|uniref:Uncharacterized protein n=1 Tax=Adineta ricciae TaxID=249248 RepID=A0A815DPQ5_ADIRI|nr:unnamed protein product [Adineta ricciae]